MDPQGFHVRVAEPTDSLAVEASFRSSPHRHDFSKLIEDSLYSLLGLSSDDEVLAFAAFNDAPNVPGGVFGKKASDIKAWAMDMSSTHGFRVDNSLWVESYVVPPFDSHAEEKYLKAFLSAFFKISPQTRAVLTLSTFEHGTSEILKPICTSEEMQLSLSACIQRGLRRKRGADSIYMGTQVTISIAAAEIGTSIMRSRTINCQDRHTFIAGVLGNRQSIIPSKIHAFKERV